jgi:hypothetical protein
MVIEPEIRLRTTSPFRSKDDHAHGHGCVYLDKLSGGNQG